MTARQHFYAEDLTETSTTSTSYGDKVALTGTFDNGVVYWILYTAKIKNTSNTSADVKLRLRDDTAGADLRAVNYEMKQTSNAYSTVFGLAKFTGAGSSQTFSIEFAAESSGNNCFCSDAAIIAIAADAADAYAESLGTSTETAGSITDKTTLTFTPATSGDYLIIAAAELRSSVAGQEAWAQLLLDDGSSLVAADSRGNKDGTNFYAWSTAIKRTLSASSKTFKIQFKTQDAVGETATIQNAAIVAIRLDVLANAYYANSAAGTATNSTSFQDVATLTQTPAAADHLLLWWGSLNVRNASDTGLARFMQGASELSRHEEPYTGGRAANRETAMAFRKSSLSATSTTWKTQVACLVGGGTNTTLDDSGIAVLELVQAGGGGGAFAYKKALTIDHTQCGSANSTDWPLTIALDGNVQAADADLKSIANGGHVESASGYDIRPFSDSGLTTPLDYELVNYDPTTGALEMHVRIPTLDHSTDVVIYLGYGNPGLTTDGSSASTWNSDFKRVFHFGDGATLSVVDSTGTEDAVDNGSSDVDAGAGELFGGAVFNGTSNAQSLQISSSSPALVYSESDWTISAWVKPDSVSADHFIFSENAAAGVIFFLRISSSGKLQGGIHNGTIFQETTGATSISAADIRHVAFTRRADGSTEVFLNGVSDATGTNSGYFLLPSTSAFINKITNTGAEGNFDGFIDEWRLAFAALSDSWILADYNSQKPSSTFITWGSEESTSGIDADVAEGSATAADTPSASSAATGSAAESGSGADIPSASVVFSASTAETGSAIDTPSTTAIVEAAAAESGAGADTPGAASILPASVSESGACAETPDAGVGSGSSCSEAGSATDTQAGAITTPASIDETGNATDTPSATAVLAGSAAESGACADTPDGSIVGQDSACSEGSATAADDQSAVVITNGSVAEGTASAADLAAAQAVWEAFIAEGSATAEDTQDWNGGLFSVDCAEGSETAADTPSVQVVFLASLTESGAGADTPSAIITATASVAEISSSSDSPSASAQVPAAVAEGGATGADTQDWSGQTGASCDEGTDTAAGTQDALTMLGAAVSEAGSAVDAPLAIVTLNAATAEGSATAVDLGVCAAIFVSSVAEGSATAIATCFVSSAIDHGPITYVYELQTHEFVLEAPSGSDRFFYSPTTPDR